MQFTSFFTGAAVLLALTPSVLSAGMAHIVNKCGYPVYYASVASGANNGMVQLPAGGMSQSMSNSPYGVSVKLAGNSTGGITQFEYTMAGGRLNYDMSNINGNPFASGGMSLVPSMQGDSAFPTCIPINCPAGQSVCSAAYNAPNDVRTMVCNAATDITLTLCPNGPTKRIVTDHVHRIHARHLPKIAPRA